MQKKKLYITTPIYYPNGSLHIGNTYTTIIADIIKRYNIMIGRDTYFLTGTDEHGEKIQKTAAEKGLDTKVFLDEIIAEIKELWAYLDIDYDKFIRTTDQYHKDVVTKIFSKFLANDDIYKAQYKGDYCISCETFYTKTQLVDENKCPTCGKATTIIEEEAYFFRMSKYSDRLIQYYKDHPEFLTPEPRKNEMLNNFLLPGLEDLCVSRTSFDWGIKVAEDPRHVVYVWLDALNNYITALGYLQDDDFLFNKYWNEDTEIVHLMAKEIVRFHSIYWPIFLMALDLPLPDRVIAHGWINMKDGKMSKSKGNVIYPKPLVEKYGHDAFRNFLIRGISFGNDGTFTPEDFVARYNSDLANELGNLLSRTTAMIAKYFDGIVPEYQGHINEVDQSYEQFGLMTIQKVEKFMADFELTKALDTIFEYAARTNKYIDETAPWVLAKDEANKTALASSMNHLANGLRQIAILLQPFFLETPNAIFTGLGINDELKTYTTINDYKALANSTVKKQAPLFARLDTEKEIAYIVDTIRSGVNK